MGRKMGFAALLLTYYAEALIGDSFSHAQEVANARGYQVKSVVDYGTVGDGLADDYPALQAAVDDAGFRCIFFPAGIYRHSLYLNLKLSNSCLIADDGALLSNSYPGTSGYWNDGIRIGDASARDGGTGTSINIHDVYVSGFHFDGGGRIGVWVVYGRDVTVANISGAGQAVVAVGNDTDDECERVTVRGVIRTGPTTSDWYTAAIFNSEHFLLENVVSNFPVGSQAVAITNSRWGTVRNVAIDQQDALHDGIALLDSKYVLVSNFIVRRARKGIVLYSDYLPPYRAAQFNAVGPGRILDSKLGVHIYSRFNTVMGVETGDGMREGHDARQNLFLGNSFRSAEKAP